MPTHQDCRRIIILIIQLVDFRPINFHSIMVMIRQHHLIFFLPPHVHHEIIMSSIGQATL
jgi:hypothetical protein